MKILSLHEVVSKRKFMVFECVLMLCSVVALFSERTVSNRELMVSIARNIQAKFRKIYIEEFCTIFFYIITNLIFLEHGVEKEISVCLEVSLSGEL